MVLNCAIKSYFLCEALPVDRVQCFSYFTYSQMNFATKSPGVSSVRHNICCKTLSTVHMLDLMIEYQPVHHTNCLSGLTVRE